MTNDTPNETTCVAASEGRSMIGTVDHVDGWLLLEAPGRWGAQWHDAEAVDAGLRQQIEALLAAAAAEGLKLRPQLVKQQAVRGQRVLLLAHERLWLLAGGLRALKESPATGLSTLFRAAKEAPATAVRAAGGQLQALSEPQYFVCTNGQRDRCCGALGMPLYRALSAAVQQRAWQISHVGGHRFAPNVLVTPGALLYGRVAPAVVERFLAAVEGGCVAFDWLRGRSSYPPLVQAAEAFLARQGLELVAVESAGTEPERGRVVFSAGAEQLAIDVGRSSETEAVLASCGAPTLKSYSPFATRPSSGATGSGRGSRA
ncbi:MAG: sucrase ferredoxin [Pseudomonadota bacterium]